MVHNGNIEINQGSADFHPESFLCWNKFNNF